MNIDCNKLPVSAEFVTPRRCGNQVGCDGQLRTCGWHLFDTVIVLADVSHKAPKNQGEALRFSGFACRSCGAVQPDGIPAELYDKL